MATSSTPAWSASRAGLLGDTGAVDHANQINQFLGTHADMIVYQGSSILTPNGSGGAAWAYQLGTQDISQPFTMSGTTIGRVQVPLLPVGGGADLIVSLCANSSGVPGTVLQQSRIPAAFITQLGAASGLDSSGPLAAPPENALLYSGWLSVPWSPPATGATGGLSTAQMAQSGPYMIFAGGVNAANGNSSATVATVTWVGGTTISTTSAGPQLPQALLSGGLAVTPDSLCYVGGVNINGASSVVQSTVYLASWNSSTGAIGTWSVQTALPHALVSPGVAAYGPTDTVYVVGGSTNYAPENAVVSTVYYAAITGGQITGWTSAPSLPVQVADPTVAVVGNWLIAAGGFNASGNGSAAVYYAPINPATGVPGAWTTGPSVPAGLYVEGPAAVSDVALAWPQTLSLATSLVVQDTLTLTWGANGPGMWAHQVGPLPALNQDQVAAMVATGNGAYQVFNFQNTDYLTAGVLPAPMISVPLPATGLTNGATYHIVLSQPNGDLNDYLRAYDDFDVFPGNPTLLTRAKGSSSWTAGTTGHAVPIQVYDLSAGYPGTPGGQPWHTWADNGARISTIVYATTPDRRPLGILDAVAQPGPVLNQNPTFTAGTAPWGVAHGAISQSNAFTHGALPFCALLTPTGGFSSCDIESEMVAVRQGHSYTATAWVYSPPGYSSVSVVLNWYATNSFGSFVSSTSGTVTSVPAGTWTQLAVTGPVPGTAFFGTIGVYETGTPPNTTLLYVSAATIQDASGPMLATVSAYQWANTWPAEAGKNPLGIKQLA